jgi:heme exporter protein A
MKLIVDNLSSERGGRLLFAGLSFSVANGESLLLTGPNGAGKTTLIRIVAGLATPSAGEIRLQEADSKLALGEQCHFIGHLNGVKASLTVQENAAFWSGFLGAGRERIAPALQAFGLSPLRHVPAGYLSAGQKRRLGLARVLLAERPIWLLDEPSASLDEDARAALSDVVYSHLAAGGLLVAATHEALGFSATRELQLGSAARGP